MNNAINWAWSHTPATPALGRLKLKDHEFKSRLGNIARPCVTKEYNQINMNAEMAPWAMILATKPGDLSSIPRTYMKEGDNCFLKFKVVL